MTPIAVLLSRMASAALAPHSLTTSFQFTSTSASHSSYIRTLSLFSPTVSTTHTPPARHSHCPLSAHILTLSPLLLVLGTGFSLPLPVVVLSCVAIGLPGEALNVPMIRELLASNSTSRWAIDCAAGAHAADRGDGTFLLRIAAQPALDPSVSLDRSAQLQRTTAQAPGLFTPLLPPHAHANFDSASKPPSTGFQVVALDVLVVLILGYHWRDTAQNPRIIHPHAQRGLVTPLPYYQLLDPVL
ncbi:hypothetical protein C8F01DRAFT_1265686 [Mycena amicta]|nr:hypothetical protein C8F01DRAFT_1265686 [Mycena amicta]